MKHTGFLLKKEQADSHIKDYVLGADAQPDLKGISDEVAGMVWALFAWSYPINGVYPRSEAPINHASLGINEKCKPFLPKGTTQRGREDWMNCTSNAPCNELEIQFNYGLKNNKFTPSLVEWFNKVGFINNGKFEIADAWSTIGSGTTRNGNSLKSPVDFIHRNGIVPRSKMLDLPTMTWSQYHGKSRMTSELKEIADEILKYIDFGYQKVLYRDFIKYTHDLKWEDFDSYVDHVDGDYIKKLAPDYNLMSYGYHLTINQKASPKVEPINEEIMQFYKEPGTPKVYQKGADGLYHHLSFEPLFRGLYGAFKNHEIIEQEIPDDKIGFSLYNKKSFADLILKLLGKGK